MKTFDSWQKDALNNFLQVGDRVDEHFADWAMSVMPPATFTRTMIQIGEACDDVAGRATFTTFIRLDSISWEYRGECYKGESNPPVVFGGAK